MGQAFSFGGKLSMHRVCGKNGVCYYTNKSDQQTNDSISLQNNQYNDFNRYTA